MKTFQSTIAILAVLIFTISCSNDDNVAPNTLTFKEKPIIFNGLSIDDEAPNGTSEYIFTTSSGLSMKLYCFLTSGEIQTNEMDVIAYSADSEIFYPVERYPDLTVRGYINYEDLQYYTNSGQVKIKRNAIGNHTFEFVNFKVKVGTEEQLLNGIIDLPKS